MRDKISLSISNTIDIKLAYTVFDYLQKRLDGYDLSNIHSAFVELLENIIMHAYERSYDINLVIDFLISSCQLRIDIEDTISRARSTAVLPSQRPNGIIRRTIVASHRNACSFFQAALMPAIDQMTAFKICAMIVSFASPINIPPPLK